MNVSEWQKRLEDNFTVQGVIGGPLLDIMEMEKEYGDFFIQNYHGQSVLIDSFQGFYIETLRTTERWIAMNGWPKDAPNYAPILFLFVTIFRSFRACEILLTNGYPLNGYALLRDLKDRAIFLCAIARNITFLPSIYYGYSGMESANDKTWSDIKKKRKQEEHRVLSKMIRKDSGLPEEVRKELDRWEQMFHEEVHGSRFTFFLEGGDWMKGKEHISIGPAPKERSMAMYMNRAAEIGWMLTRLLPFLQPVQDAFGAAWKGRYIILDDSFRVMVQALSELGKPIADAFMFFIDKKFAFPETFHYFEADGSFQEKG